MRAALKSRLESFAHLTVIAVTAVSLVSSFILFIGGVRFSFSEDAEIFYLLSISSWLFLVLLTLFLNIIGSVHHRFSLWAMLAALFGIMLVGYLMPAVT